MTSSPPSGVYVLRRLLRSTDWQSRCPCRCPGFPSTREGNPGLYCCSNLGSWTTIENSLILSVDFEFIGASPGEPSSPDPPKAKNVQYSPCRNERRGVDGRARCVRYVCTTSEHWTVGTRFCLCSCTLGVVLVKPGMSVWLIDGFPRPNGRIPPPETLLP